MTEKEEISLVCPKYYNRKIEEWVTGRIPCTIFASLSESSTTSTTDYTDQKEQEDPFKLN